MKIFDTHAHYNDEKFDIDRAEVLKMIKKNYVDKVMLVSSEKKDLIDLRKFIKEYDDKSIYPEFYFSIGIHPDVILGSRPESIEGVKFLEEIEKSCYDENGKLIAKAIGEIGLDYYGDGKNDETKELQKLWFIEQLKIAKKLNLPIIIHSREACLDTLNIIKEYGKGINGVIHCFAYEKEIALEYVKLGFYIGIGGTVTFKNNRKTKEVVSAIPIEYIVTETDCPYLAPTPHRGERNDSHFIMEVIKEINSIKIGDLEILSEILYKNALNLYKISL